jgi:hypothetical protein
MENHSLARWLILALLFAAGAAAAAAQSGHDESGIDAVAERYVRLQLAIGVHDPEHLGWYYGPPQWRTQAEADRQPIGALATSADRLLEDARSNSARARDPLVQRRWRFLLAHLQAARFRLDQLAGVKLPFDEEARRLFGVVPDLQRLESYDAVLARIDALVPGSGPLSQRVEAFRNRFAVPAERTAAVMQAAVEECRRRTRAHIVLPATDAFSLELVRDTGWSGNNLYRGDARGTIQFNTDAPIVVDRVVELACHESYPGHHTHVSLLDERLVRQRGWIEYSVFPLYGPIGFIAEGEASNAYAVAFAPQEQVRFESTVLYPLAGLDPSAAPQLRALRSELNQLPGARLTIGRLFLDGKVDRAHAQTLLEKYQLVAPAFAEKILAFIEKYRSYIINYGLGEIAVRDYLRGRGNDAATRWRSMEALISEPTLPADLRDFR